VGGTERSDVRPGQDGSHFSVEVAEDTVRVGDHEVSSNKHATRWLGVWIDSKMTLKEHHSARMKSARKAMGRLRRLTGQMGLCPDACRKALVACGQATALYGAELWWDGRKGAGVKNRCDELQKLENQLGWAVTGNFRTTNLGRVGIAPGGVPLEQQKPTSCAKADVVAQGKPSEVPPGDNTAMGRRMVHFSDYSGRVEEITPTGGGATELGAAIPIAVAEWGEEGGRPTSGRTARGTRTGQQDTRKGLR